ncbi:MAG TPA: TlpA disulfide reductase family protein [Thermoleophilaceae bacterium]
MKRLLAPIPLAAIVVTAALIALLAYGLTTSGTDKSIDNAVASGKRPNAPALTLPRLTGGGESSLAEYKGKVVLVNYWASWCPPCRTEAPLLERWHQKMTKAGGTVLGIDVLDTTDDALAFARAKGLTYPMLRDGDGKTQGKFGLTGYPESFVIDRDGKIAALQRGAVDDKFMLEKVQPLLEAQQ